MIHFGLQLPDFKSCIFFGAATLRSSARADGWTGEPDRLGYSTVSYNIMQYSLQLPELKSL